MICFTADAARALFGIALADIHDRVLDAHACLGNDWHPLLDALSGADRDADALAAIERHLAPRWQALRPATPLSSLRNAGRSCRAPRAAGARMAGYPQPAQVERRIKTQRPVAARMANARQDGKRVLCGARPVRSRRRIQLGHAGAGRRVRRPGAPEPRGQAHHGVLAERPRNASSTTNRSGCIGCGCKAPRTTLCAGVQHRSTRRYAPLVVRLKHSRNQTVIPRNPRTLATHRRLIDDSQRTPCTPVARFGTRGHDVANPGGGPVNGFPQRAANRASRDSLRTRLLLPTSARPCHYAHSERWSPSPDTAHSRAPAKPSASRNRR